MAILIALAYATAEVAASVATSASRQDCLEDIPILTVVVAEPEPGKIERQILLAYVVVGADHTAFQQSPEAFNVVSH